MSTDAKELLEALERYCFCVNIPSENFEECLGCPFDGYDDCADRLWDDICNRVCAVLRENEEMRRVLAIIATSRANNGVTFSTTTNKSSEG
jgi:hypothetical protein